MDVLLKAGIIGGVWALLSASAFLVVLLSSSGFTESHTFRMVTPILIVVSLAGIASIFAIAALKTNPRLSSAIVWSSIGVILIACIVGAGVWDIFVLPGALLMVPAAFRLAYPKNMPGPAAFGLAGSFWALICGGLIFSIVALPAMIHGQPWSTLTFPAAAAIVVPLFSLTGVIVRNKLPLLSEVLIWSGVAGIFITLYTGLGYFSFYLFAAILLLAFSAVELRMQHHRPGLGT